MYSEETAEPSRHNKYFFTQYHIHLSSSEFEGRVRSVPLDLRIRRILLPVPRNVSKCVSNFLRRWDRDAIIPSSRRTSNKADLGNSVGVTQDDTDLGGGGTTLGETADLLNDLVGSGLQPRGGSAAVRGSRRADTLSLGVKTTHGCGVW